MTDIGVCFFNWLNFYLCEIGHVSICICFSRSRRLCVTIRSIYSFFSPYIIFCGGVHQSAVNTNTILCKHLRVRQIKRRKFTKKIILYFWFWISCLWVYDWSNLLLVDSTLYQIIWRVLCPIGWDGSIPSHVEPCFVLLFNCRRKNGMRKEKTNIVPCWFSRKIKYYKLSRDSKYPICWEMNCLGVVVNGW
jgi:hypothetical protein